MIRKIPRVFSDPVTREWCPYIGLFQLVYNTQQKNHNRRLLYEHYHEERDLNAIERMLEQEVKISPRPFYLGAYHGILYAGTFVGITLVLTHSL